jgi:hypothetical protein
MSSTNPKTRGGGGVDFFATPSWCVHRLLERLELPGGNWLEPAAGDGAIIKAVQAPHIKWHGVELREECRKDLEPLVVNAKHCIGDFLTGCFTTKFEVILSNPPFSLAMEFIQESLKLAPHIVLLLRTGFISSKERCDFFRGEMPDLYQLPNRPSFTNGGSDSAEYAFFHWGPERGRREGKLILLDDTPIEQRRRLK